MKRASYRSAAASLLRDHGQAGNWETAASTQANFRIVQVIRSGAATIFWQLQSLYSSNAALRHFKLGSDER